MATPSAGRKGANDSHGEVAPGPVPILGRMALRDGDPIYFYELHEGDEDVFFDILLAHDAEYDEQEFLEMVLESRKAVIDSYQEDTLTEAVAHELERRHGFLAIEDRLIRGAINVSAEEAETRVVQVDEGGPAAEDYRSLLVDIEPDDAVWQN
jgi:hypothetical protein